LVLGFPPGERAGEEFSGLFLREEVLGLFESLCWGRVAVGFEEEPVRRVDGDIWGSFLAHSLWRLGTCGLRVECLGVGIAPWLATAFRELLGNIRMDPLDPFFNNFVSMASA
jgi:hypothetical protein